MSAIDTDGFLKKTSLFWQYPVITEKTFYDQNKNNETFLGLPWATILDKRVNINDLIRFILTNLKNQPEYTCCQHISFRKLIPLFKVLKIKTLYSPHKIKGEDYINDIKILPCPLYAVNIEDSERNTHFLNKDFMDVDRPYLYSFIGAYQKDYMSDIRLKIFQMEKNEKAIIVNTGDWHFNRVVYSKSQNNRRELNEDSKHQEKTKKYNDILLKSKYSLCPSGTGPNSIRFWESLACGSIPILLSDKMELPKNSLWEKSIIFLQERDINKIKEILSNIDNETEMSMRKNCLYLYNYYKNNYNNYDEHALLIEMNPQLIKPYYKIFGHFFLDHLFMLYKIKHYYKNEKNIEISSIFIDKALLDKAPFIKPLYESIFKIHTSYKYKSSLNIIKIGSIIGSVYKSENSNIYLSKTILKEDIPHRILENGRKISNFNKNLMKLFTKTVKQHFVNETNILPENHVLIIDRKKSPRRLLNLDKIIDKLKINDFICSVVTFDDIELSQQIQMVSKYKYVICACGSVQVHISFLRNDCKFIELCESGFRYPNTSIYGYFNDIDTYSLTSPLDSKYLKKIDNKDSNELFQSIYNMPSIIKNDPDSIVREKQFYSKIMRYNCFWIHAIQDIECKNHLENILKILNISNI